MKLLFFMLFGTDGIRGTSNIFPITPDAIIKIAQSCCFYYMHHYIKDDAPFNIVIGKDTRLSGYMIENALVSGFVSMGANVFLLGPVPTPAVGLLTKSLRANLGVMISASHNPASDNGIKFFDSSGFKLSSEIEKRIERIFKDAIQLSPANKIGKAKRLDDAAGRYIEFLKSTLPKNCSFQGLKVVVDSANGSNYKIAPQILWELGAEVISIESTPDGYNINEKCGVMDISRLQEKVSNEKADIGIAFDGDGDRLTLIDENANIISPDQIIALLATFWQKNNLLKSKNIVGTIVSNLGLEKYIQSLGLNFLKSQVGDKNVCEMMKAHHSSIGGEPSGHIILSDYVTTGDGLLVALHVLSIIKSEKLKISDAFFDECPTLEKTIPLSNNMNACFVEELTKMAKNILKNKGVVVIRPSGTQSILRIHIQSPNPKKIEEAFLVIEEKIKNSLNCAA